MAHVRQLIGATAIAALLSLSGFGVSTPASAQQQDQTQTPAQIQTGGQAGHQTGTAATGQNQPIQNQPGTAQAQSQVQQDRVLATVDGEEIRESDLIAAVQGLPTPMMQQMPDEILWPTVLDQLLTRELILARGYAERLQEDPEVQALVESASGALEEQAVVRVWVERELAERVTDQQIEEAFQQFKAANPNAEVTLEQVRPQIEQSLNQWAMLDITAELREGADITFYGPAGEPHPARAAAEVGGQGPNQPGTQDQQSGPAQGNVPNPTGSGQSGQGG